MKTSQLLLSILVMAGVTYLIRMLPLAIFRTKLRSTYLKSFLYYVPYAVLSAMTVPAIFESTSSAWSAAAGFAVAVIMSYCGAQLLPVALAACAAVYVAEWGMRFFA